MGSFVGLESLFVLGVWVLGVSCSYETPGPDTLISRNATVTASSNNSQIIYDVSHAVDGSTNSCASTGQQNQPWIQIDLGNIYEVAGIEVMDLTDLNDSISAISIYLHDEGTNWMQNHTLVEKIAEENVQYYNNTLANPVKARYVTLQSQENEFRLSVCEVNIYGKCPAGKYGFNCSSTCHCSENKSCDRINGSCPDNRCDLGWQGSNCSEECPAGKFGFNCNSTCHCSENMSCDRITGSCPCNRCDLGWQGSSCSEECPAGKFGFNCSSTCYCSENEACDRINGSCPGNRCDIGWQGSSCSEECPAGKYGFNCSSTCHCSENKTCDRINGSCTGNKCDKGWQGSNCSEECPSGKHGSNCEISCDCPEKSCDPITGSCPENRCSKGKGAINLTTPDVQVSMSSVSPANSVWNATKAIDGHCVADPAKCNCCSQTDQDTLSWWQVDLGRPFFVKQLTVYARINENNFKQLVGFSVFTSLTEAFPQTAVFTSQDHIIKDNKVVVELPDVAARFVRIQRAGILTICEIEIIHLDFNCPVHKYGRDCAPCGPCNNGSCDPVIGVCPYGCYEGYIGNKCETFDTVTTKVTYGFVGAGALGGLQIVVAVIICAVFWIKKRSTQIYEQTMVKWTKGPTTNDSEYCTLDEQERQRRVTIEVKPAEESATDEPELMKEIGPELRLTGFDFVTSCLDRVVVK